VARKYVFARFKTLNDISDVAVEGGIVSKLFKIYTIDIQTQVPMSYKDGIPTLLSICPMAISIINMQNNTRQKKTFCLIVHVCKHQLHY
jgi:hypothetical protein